jgi:ferredoxin-NADP reductase
MLLRVRSITWLAERINGYEFVDPNGHDLPRFAAGAHVDVQLTNGLVRQYSLCNDPAERRRYLIAVLRESESRGGSWHLYDTVRAGDLLEVSVPRNNFPLVEDAARHLLLAGGIGIAPIMAMIATLRTRRAEFLVHYCTRTPERTAFRDDLFLLAAEGRVRIHHDDGDPKKGVDIAAALADPQPGTHLYYCGPSAMMEAAKAAAAGWPAGSVHCEYFAPSPEMRRQSADRPFLVKLAKSGDTYPVPVGDSIVGVLRAHGVRVNTSCELGYCGACLTRWLAGEPDHRDQVLDAEGQKRWVMICCARARSPVLELDL